MRVRVQLVLIGHLPSPACHTIIIRSSFCNSRILRLLCVESISIEILLATDLTSTLGSIGLEDSVVGAIDVRIDTETEEMLMIVGVNAGVDFGSPALGVLARVHGICV